MLQITPRHLKSYTQCPKRTWYSWKTKPKPSFEHAAINQTIKYVYLYQTRRNTVPSWRLIPPLVDKHMRTLYPDEFSQERYKTAVSLLSKLHVWYNDIYLEKYFDEAIVNFPVKLMLYPNVQFHDDIDIVMVGSKLRIFDTIELDENHQLASYNPRMMYNDYETHARLWAFWRFTETLPNEYVRIVIGPQKLKAVRMVVRESMLTKTEKLCRQLIWGMHTDIWYPSISEQCITCPFRKHCSV